MRIILPLVMTLALALPTASAAQTPAAWIVRSNALAEEFTADLSQRTPEIGTSFGYRQFDAQAVAIEDDMEAKDRAFVTRWTTKLDQLTATEKDPDLLIDLAVLRDLVERSRLGTELDERYGVIPLYAPAKWVFENLRQLVNEQSGDRKTAALPRFKAYVHGHGDSKPLTTAYKSRIEHLERKQGPKAHLYPLKTEVEQYLADADSYVKGIEQLLVTSGAKDWQKDFEAFQAQLGAYHSFLKDHLLPKARADYRMPPEIYQSNLRARGIKASPEELIATARADYAKVYEDFKTTAREVAKARGLEDSTPVAVLAHLKKRQVTKPDDVRVLFERADQTLKTMIETHAIVSLPKTPLRIRLGSDAESKAVPVPQLVPPPLVGNRGERPEFLVPTSSTGTMPFDDFSYEAAALILTAHEGRPGHDLQFSMMLDTGVSTIRARYAFNNVNVEGWGLYAEDLVYPHLPLDAKLPALQMRLWRIARMFLDPEVQLGKSKPEDVVRVFTKELGVSKAMADLEVRRYTFDDPGQAPSYYYGLKQLLAAKAATKAALGTAFEERCFNDGVLAMGLLPVDLIADRLRTTLSCGKGRVN